VGHAGSTAPVSPAHRNDVEFGDGDSPTDGVGNLTGALHAETDVSFAVSNGDESLKSCALTGRTLFLDGHDLHDLVLEGRKKMVDDLCLLHGDGEEENILEPVNFSVLH